MVAAPADDETVAEFILNGASDCIDRNRLSLLPLAVALAVEERAARDDRNRMEQELQRTRSLYNALVENPTFGVCQVNANGLFGNTRTRRSWPCSATRRSRSCGGRI